jgi:4-O-beta-D-mannosyl-D-glucose phosphorylase
LVDYVLNSPEDTFISAGSVNTIIEQVNKNKAIL